MSDKSGSKSDVIHILPSKDVSGKNEASAFHGEGGSSAKIENVMLASKG